jgi:CheY-like chemotaxis protein
MTAPANLKRILIVDDDPAYREMLSTMMEQLRKGLWDITTAADAGRALTILREKVVHLLLVDARMPVVDGLQLIRLVRQNHPHLRIAVLTGYADEATRATYTNNGADLFFEKPRSAEGIQTLFLTLDDLLRSTPEHGFRGVLEQVELQDLLQIECSKRNSSRIEVITHDGSGLIFIRDGAVIHAVAGEISGEAAFYHLLSLKGGELRVRAYEDPERVSITNSWMSLLMEWAQRRDEISPPASAGGSLVLHQPEPSATDAGSGDAAVSTILAHPLTEAEKTPLPHQIEEILVCSAAGEVLFERGCGRMLDCKHLLDSLVRRAAQLNAVLPLGRLEVVEFEAGQSRCAVQALSDVGVFVRAREVEPAAAGPEART